MRNGTFRGQTQEFYFLEDHPTMPRWFKGMEVIIKEHGLWPAEGLNAQCDGFKCDPGRTQCCCRRLLFTQPDFVSQKSQLEEFVTSRGHICDFYPKYHCELNFIEQYWGASKIRYRSTTRTSNLAEMEKNMLACLDDVPLLQIQQFVLHSCFTHDLKTYWLIHSLLKVRKPVSALHFCICTGSIRCSGCLGKQKISWPPYPSSRYCCRSQKLLENLV